jgi:predicted lipase
MEIRKMSQSELDKAVKEEIERLGGYDAWRKKGWINEVASEPQKPRTQTKSEQYADACKLAAQYRGISIEQFFKQEPERYAIYRQLVLEE